MIKKVVYVADDGEEFENKEECKEYEESLRQLGCIMLDLELEKTDSFGKAYVIDVRDHDDLKRIKGKTEYYGYDVAGIDSPGKIYVYHDLCDKWFNKHCVEYISTVELKNLINEIENRVAEVKTDGE